VVALSMRTRARMSEAERQVEFYQSFRNVMDRLLLEFVHTKLDLYKKLTEPKINEMLKRQWFEVLASGM
jgi:hypothetical protein